jgi:hypothetical protein
MDQENGYTMECYAGIRKNGIMSFSGKRMELVIVILSKRNQTQKNKYNKFSLICEI